MGALIINGNVTEREVVTHSQEARIRRSPRKGSTKQTERISPLDKLRTLEPMDLFRAMEAADLSDREQVLLLYRVGNLLKITEVAKQKQMPVVDVYHAENTAIAKVLGVLQPEHGTDKKDSGMEGRKKGTSDIDQLRVLAPTELFRAMDAAELSDRDKLILISHVSYSKKIADVAGELGLPVLDVYTIENTAMSSVLNLVYPEATLTDTNSDRKEINVFSGARVGSAR